MHVVGLLIRILAEVAQHEIVARRAKILSAITHGDTTPGLVDRRRMVLVWSLLQLG